MKPGIRSGTVGMVGDIFDIDRLLPELVLALGLALILGNGFAWWKHRRGETPKGVDEAGYRPGRVVWLTAVGVLLTVWGAISLVT
jgi:hypothetical protein